MKPTFKTITSPLCGAVAILLSFTANAQTTNRPAATLTSSRGAESQSQFGPIHLMKQTLNLSDQQAQKLEPIFKEQQAKLLVLRQDASLSRQERAAKLKQVGESMNAKVKLVLTSDQMAKWQRMQTNYQNSARRFRSQPNAP